MTYNLAQATEVLRNTPDVLEALLSNLSSEWTAGNEGPDTWSAFDVVGHLIHGEHRDWIERMEIILREGTDRTFQPFDRFAMLRDSVGKSLPQLLEEFRTLREQNLITLGKANIGEAELDRTATHPALGTVTLRNLLATWVAHDLGHIGQIVRVMAKQYKDEVGPWKEYLRVVKE